MTSLDQMTIERYSLALEVSPVAMLLVDETGKIILANASALELFDYPSGDLIDKKVDILVPKDLRDEHPHLRQAYLSYPTKRGMGAGRELQGVTRTGQIIALELGLEPVRNGSETWALVTVIDIRERKIQERRVRVAMDAAASAMVMVNGQGEIIFANRAAGTLFGYTLDELMDQPIEVLVPENIHRRHKVLVASFVSTTKSRQMAKGRDLVAVRKDGSTFPVEVSLTHVELGEGRAVMSTIVDLSERVQAAQALAKANEELAAINADLTQFAYSASHDLKAPLTSICGLLGFCLEDLESGNLDELRENVEKAAEISKRSAEKVEQVLRVARAGIEAVEHEEFELEALIQDVCTDLMSALDHKIELKLVFGHREAIIAERPTLKVILENLVSNALRYYDEKKSEHWVQVRSWVSDGKLNVEVADNGIGIAEENQAAIFEMFKRLDVRSQDGLGLALVKKQIDRLGGSISVEGEEGQGARFTVVVPVST